MALSREERMELRRQRINRRRGIPESTPAQSHDVEITISPNAAQEAQKTIVSLSADATRDYAFPVPLTALLWRDKIGFNPVTFLVGDWSSERSKCIKRAFDHHGLTTHFVGTSDKYQTSTLAQNIREHAAAIFPKDDDTWLLPGDADLWPLKQNFYHQHLGTSHKVVVYYSNGDHFTTKEAVREVISKGSTNYQTLPTCHVTMRVKTWHELYKYNTQNPLEAAVETLDRWLQPKIQGKTPSEAGWESWMSDQRILTENVCFADWFPQQAKLIERRGHPPVDRLDRGHPSDWNGQNISRWTDAHLLREPEINWQKIRPLVAHHLPQHLEWADNYQSEYIKL
jgi:hypothetical protein